MMPGVHIVLKPPALMMMKSWGEQALWIRLVMRLPSSLYLSVTLPSTM